MVSAEAVNTEVLSTDECRVSTGVDAGHSSNLDCLRSIAILAVVVSHVATALEVKTFAWSLYYIGHLGVLLFFIHTCFVLLSSLGRMGEAGTFRRVKRFYIHRLFRIYPLYALVIAVSLLCRIPWTHTLAADPGSAWEGWGALCANLLLLQNLFLVPSVSGPMWSLPFEMQMYLFLPAIYAITRSREALLKLTLIAFFAILASVGLQIAFPHLYRGVFVPPTDFVPCFLGGAYAFALSRRRALLPAFTMPLLLMGLAALYIAHPFAWVGWLVCSVVGASWWAISEIKNAVLITTAKAIARYSYALYLWHWPMLWLWFRHYHLSRSGALAFLVSTIALSVVSYHAVEAPLIRAGHRLANKLSTRRQTNKAANLLLQPQ